MWKCKRCGCEVTRIETVNTTTTYKLTKNQKRRKIKDRSSDSWEVGYICSNPDCKNTGKYFDVLENIAEWEEDK